MTEEHRYSADDIGKRIIYTDRQSEEHAGVIRDVIESVQQLDVNLDNFYSSRVHYFVPADAVRFE